jgi:protein-disulfide isomerase
MDEQKEITSFSEPVQPSQEGDKKTGIDISRLFLPVAILLAAVMISGTLLYTRKPVAAPSEQGQQEVKKVDVSADDDPFIGNAAATVTVIEFSDYQCPFCRMFWESTYLQLKKNYIDTGKIKFVYRDYPLPFHPAAIPSAIAAQCANDQGKYWEMHDKIFSEQNKLDVQKYSTVQFGATELKKWAKELGLNSSFNKCLDDSKYADEVTKDTSEGQAAGVSGTPSFFINGTMLVGAQPYAEFQKIIDKELSSGGNKKKWGIF